VCSERADCVIGLGANLGDRQATLAWAVRRCAGLGRVVAVSALYETKPVGGPAQPDFLNAALRLHTDLDPLLLWSGLAHIERCAGRVRAERWGPRTLDLDILWIRGVRLRQGVLAVPHPRLRVRVFALLTLLEVAPDATDPASGQSYAEVLARLDASGIRIARSGAAWAGFDA
jgi:2-amino-4-hydroxy-6-hydroxymethyldihydropteridine diphosphokinase